VPSEAQAKGECVSDDVSVMTVAPEAEAGGPHRTHTVEKQRTSGRHHVLFPGGKGPVAAEAKKSAALGGGKRKNLPANVTMAITGGVLASGSEEEEERFYTDDGFEDQTSMDPFLQVDTRTNRKHASC
jgi:hypothetical protein